MRGRDLHSLGPKVRHGAALRGLLGRVGVRHGESGEKLNVLVQPWSKSVRGINGVAIHLSTWALVGFISRPEGIHE